MRGHRLVQLNLSLQLLDTVKDWYDVELNFNKKSLIYEALTIEFWVNALINRFKPQPAQLLHQLEQAHYTRVNAANKKDPVKFLHKILRLTRYDNRPDFEQITIAYIHFKSQLRMNLILLREGESIQDFIEQLEAKKDAWYDTYQYFWKKDPYLSNPASSQQSYDSRSLQSKYPHNPVPATQQRQLSSTQPAAFYVDPYEQAVYAKHGGPEPRGYPSNGRKTPPPFQESYDFEDDF